MKIGFDSGINRIGNAVRFDKKSRTSSPAAKKTGVFDEIRLSSRENKGFSELIDGIKSQMASDIMSSKPIGELNEIRTQLDSGAYNISAAEVTDDILFDIR